MFARTAAPLWRYRMAAHARDRRATLAAHLAQMTADALDAFDAGATMLANVSVHPSRDGMRAAVAVDPATVARRSPARPDGEMRRVA